MTINLVDDGIVLRNVRHIESTYDEMVLAFSKDVLPNDLIREALPPWPLRLEITPDEEGGMQE